MATAAGLTTTGLLRGNNEDCAAVDGLVLAEDTPTTFPIGEGRHLLVLADGIGGYEHGEIASRAAVDALSRTAPHLTDEDACIESVRAANSVLYAMMRRDRSLIGMGTTIVGVTILDTRAIWFNVGDSRAYQFRGGLRQLTTDHVPAARMPDGQRSHTLTQWLGGIEENEELYPEVGSIEIAPGDKLLLCSDGLTDVVADEEIARLLARDAGPESTVRRLADEVLSRGAPDNVAVLLAAF